MINNSVCVCVCGDHATDLHTPYGDCTMTGASRVETTPRTPPPPFFFPYA